MCLVQVWQRIIESCSMLTSMLVTAYGGVNKSLKMTIKSHQKHEIVTIVKSPTSLLICRSTQKRFQSDAMQVALPSKQIVAFLKSANWRLCSEHSFENLTQNAIFSMERQKNHFGCKLSNQSWMSTINSISDFVDNPVLTQIQRNHQSSFEIHQL